MNPGYLSFVLLVVSLILYASGWTDFLMRGITSKVILLFFILWIVSMETSVSLMQIRVSLWAVMLLAIAAVVLWRSHGILHKLHLVSAAVLIGSVSFFLQETIHLMPALVLGSAELSAALLIGLLVSALVKLPAAQLAVISIGLLLGETYYRYVHKGHLEFHLGSALLQDRWWLTVYAARMLSVMLACLVLISRKSLLWIVSGIRKRIR
ncbi:YphA family membrane protein [Paenibacillus piri]|uniref:Uncharacterized protein n=1 Tax=Paenibacillus piri TaxID=2547395 RepID=A0A4R5KVY4_9BACL|nr:hypothetical protein [Paenibacillus piri]TDF99328.1 hypothetical protein E1757_05555 [Paenibacillus piri]